MLSVHAYGAHACIDRGLLKPPPQEMKIRLALSNYIFPISNRRPHYDYMVIDSAWVT